MKNDNGYHIVVTYGLQTTAFSTPSFKVSKFISPIIKGWTYNDYEKVILEELEKINESLLDPVGLYLSIVNVVLIFSEWPYESLLKYEGVYFLNPKQKSDFWQKLVTNIVELTVYCDGEHLYIQKGDILAEKHSLVGLELEKDSLLMPDSELFKTGIFYDVIVKVTYKDDGYTQVLETLRITDERSHNKS